MYYMICLDEMLKIGQIVAPRKIMMAVVERPQGELNRYSFSLSDFADELPDEGDELAQVCGKMLRPLVDEIRPKSRLVFFTYGQIGVFDDITHRNKLHTHAMSNFGMDGLFDVYLTKGLTAEEKLDVMVDSFMEMEESEFIASRIMRDIKGYDLKYYGDTQREGIMSCESYHFFGDRVNSVYHLKSCELLKAVPTQRLRGLGPKPEKSGFKPCPKCIHDAAPCSVCTKPITKRPVRTKADIMKNEISRVCQEQGMHAEFRGGTVFITTAAGEWYFDYNDRPINLKHKNENQWFDGFGNSTGNYHPQNVSLYAPIQAIAYIKRHDMAAEKRLMEDG